MIELLVFALVFALVWHLWGRVERLVFDLVSYLLGNRRGGE